MLPQLGDGLYLASHGDEQAGKRCRGCRDDEEGCTDDAEGAGAMQGSKKRSTGVQGKVGRLMCSSDDRCCCRRGVQEALMCRDRAARQS